MQKLEFPLQEFTPIYYLFYLSVIYLDSSLLFPD